MDSTIDAAQADPKMPAIASVRAARQSHEARVRFWRVLIVTSFFAVMLGANLFVGAVVMFGNMQNQTAVEEALANGKTTRITRPILDGTFCRYTVYDKITAQTLEDKVERCDAFRPKPKIKARSEFTWGGK